MPLSSVEQSLLLAAYFRGGRLDDEVWVSNSDQIVTLSLFYTGDITSADCAGRFAKRSYIQKLYDDEGILTEEIEVRYDVLIKLLERRPEWIEGGGDFELPAYPTFTACRLTTDGLQLAESFVESFPEKPDFPNWPDQRRMRS